MDFCFPGTIFLKCIKLHIIIFDLDILKQTQNCKCYNPHPKEIECLMRKKCKIVCNSTKIVNFMTPRVGFVTLDCGYSEILDYFFKKCAIVLLGMDHIKVEKRYDE